MANQKSGSWLSAHLRAATVGTGCIAGIQCRVQRGPVNLCGQGNSESLNVRVYVVAGSALPEAGAGSGAGVGAGTAGAGAAMGAGGSGKHVPGATFSSLQVSE